MNGRRSTIPQKCCLQCQFLATKDKRSKDISVPPSAREKLAAGDKQQIRMAVDMLHDYRCFRGVWTPAEEMDEVMEDLSLEAGRSRDYERIMVGRGETECFFFRYEPRMSLESAAELERRTADRREAKKDRKLTRRAFKIAFAALVVSIVATIANFIVQLVK